jgi:SOS response regulatory protein OraA/RecX
MDRVYHIFLMPSIPDMNIELRIANYITRYAPSRKKITTYLTKKKCQDIDGLLAKIGYDEDLMMTMWMRTFIATGKGKREMQMKLQKKEFPKEKTLEKLLEYESEISDWDTNVRQVEHQISTLLARGKSRRAIAMVMVGRYPYFRDQITEILEATDDSDSLTREIEKYRDKYDLTDPKWKQKFYAALMRKGFGYIDIKRGLSREE